MPGITIRDVRVIMTSPNYGRHIVVKVETSEPGLYGLGCASFLTRHLAVRSAVEDFLRPFLHGKDVQRIEDLWQTAQVNAYWRNGPVLNSALSGVDMALWDIKGKLARLPLYQLLGGKCREAATVYGHAEGREPAEVADQARALMDAGYRHIRCQMGLYGGLDLRRPSPDGALPGAYYDPEGYARGVPRLFEYLRAQLGDEVALLHDIHERLAPIEAVRLAKRLEPFGLFFLEDPLPPEQIGWFHTMRQHSAIPLAMGELFSNPNEWLPLVAGRLIDFIRVHVSAIGGITPARKLAALSEAFGVRTAWHGPGDVSPVGHAANLHLDLSCPNFGVQEWGGFTDAEREIYPGCPEVRAGYMYPNDLPGLGIDIDEAAAARFPCPEPDGGPAWLLARLPDGTAARP